MSANKPFEKMTDPLKNQTIRVCINGMTENGQIRGPVRYIFELTNKLSNHDELLITLVAGDWQKEVYKPLEEKVEVIYFKTGTGKITRGLFFLLYMPIFLHKKKFDVYHVPDTNPVPAVKGKYKLVGTIHDCAEFVVPKRFSFIQSFFRRQIAKIQATFSDHLITVSGSSKKDILHFLNVPSDKVEVIYNGLTEISPSQRGSRLRPNETLAEPYILYVGVLEREKNVEKLVEAYAQLRENYSESIKLFLVGRKANAFADIAKTIANYNIETEVEVFGYVEDSKLIDFYKNATIFAYLSEYEGFGLPILEAMQYGVPVLTSRTPCLTEISNDSALLADTNITSIKENLNQLLKNKELRKEYVQRGYRNIRNYSWESAAMQTKNVYLKVCK